MNQDETGYRGIRNLTKAMTCGTCKTRGPDKALSSTFEVYFDSLRTPSICKMDFTYRFSMWAFVLTCYIITG
jgi:hypothetical protein